MLITRAVFAETVARLRNCFDVETNLDDTEWPPHELARRLHDKAGVLGTAAERIDAPLLDANPQLRAVCLMTAGYNRVDIGHCTARGVLVTNAPDVQTETVADLGFALMMAATRRMSEAERFLRSGQWTKWRYDLLAGSDIHAATLGILSMGQIGRAHV